MQETPIKRRATQPDVRIRRRATAVMKPVNRKISGWQMQVALLKARMVSEHLHFGERAAARAEVDGVYREIEQELSDLHDTVSGLPAEVQGSNRIEDTVRAMRQIMRSVSDALATAPASQRGGSP